MFDVSAKLKAWGINPDTLPADVSVADLPVVCLCGEAGCDGNWQVHDSSGPVWIVRCDSCGFETGIPPQDTKVRVRSLMARANLPSRFVGLVFEEDDDNRDALFLARAWLHDFQADREKGEKLAGVPALAFFGEPGTGKTHLLTQLCVQLVRKLQVNVMFRSVRELLRELQRFDDEVQRTEVWERALSVDVLALDDLGAERITDWRLEQLAELIDARYLAEKPLLLTTNFPPKAWGEILDERSRHRLLDRRMVVPVLLRGRDRRQGLLSGETT